MSGPGFYVKPDYIRKGGWTNWDGDVTTGGKITVAKQNAELLMVFIGIFLVFMEAGLWSLISFALFIWRRSQNLKLVGNASTSTSADRDALWHQQQATLRNGGDDRTVGITYISLWLNYGWRDPDVFLRTFPTIFIALLSFLTFLIVLPFITAYFMLDYQGVEVLIDSPLCGWWEASFENDVVIASTEVANRTREAIQYTDICYEDDAPSELCDRFLMKRRLKWTGWHNTECPFEAEMCLGDETFPAFQMRTMLLDSHEHFGMNSPKAGRFALQRTTTCAPLDVRAWSLVDDGTLDGENITKVYFGATSSDDYTFGVSNLQSKASAGYNLASYHYYTANQSVGTFVPINELRRDDGDVSVIILNNNMVPISGINGPCRDPFYSATNRHDDAFPDWYLPDAPITAIGCVDQYAFYDPVTHDWSNQTGMLMLGTDITKETGLSPMQVAAMNTMRWALGQVGAIGRLVETVGSDMLKAKKYPGLWDGFQNPLPNDQWKKEVAYWFNTQLAALQLQFIRISTGPQDTTGMENVLPILSEGSSHDYEGMICHWQKIKDNEFKNFYRAGFVSLAVIGGLMIIAPWFLIKLVVFWGRRKKNAFVLEWISYGNLQLLRMANEEAGVGGWDKYDDEIPLSPLGKNILTVDVEASNVDGKRHPKLRKLGERTNAAAPGNQTDQGSTTQSNSQNTGTTIEAADYTAMGALGGQVGVDPVRPRINTF
ncbi:hypothetical protein B0J13DRAFT_502588 [Dactylonectria estremocensis]|uniref:Uncharacterized protein n=1 Tax=Dactylonectria estremocensis TaxID=1079267 RepID=A0A9P9EV88_9HYPO|nr:hypothetical protein B0J13DRAFT_502588 [Dactylonectria estremocensis]